MNFAQQNITDTSCLTATYPRVAVCSQRVCRRSVTLPCTCHSTKLLFATLRPRNDPLRVVTIRGLNYIVISSDTLARGDGHLANLGKLAIQLKLTNIGIDSVVPLA